MLTCSGLPCNEVLQRRSPKDGFEKSRIGLVPVDGVAQGYQKGSPAKRLALIMGTQDCRAALQTILLPAVVRAQHVALLAPARG